MQLPQAGVCCLPLDLQCPLPAAQCPSWDSRLRERTPLWTQKAQNWAERAIFGGFSLIWMFLFWQSYRRRAAEGTEIP